MDAFKRDSILVIEDQRSNIEELVGLLEPDYDLFVALDADSGMSRLVELSPKLVLLNINMPGMNRFEVRRMIKQALGHHNTPVIFITAQCSSADEVRSLALGETDYISKSFYPELVKARIKNQMANIKVQNISCMTSTLHWKKELHLWAERTVQHFTNDKRILAILIGGSLAHGQEWKHSDMELALVVREKIDSIPYFNVIESRGVEIFQLTLDDLSVQIQESQRGNLKVVMGWPIQLWRGKIIKDHQGILGSFQEIFGPSLFSDPIIKLKIQEQEERISELIAQAAILLAANRPRASLIVLRDAMNHILSHFYWRKRELPRSQNRSERMLKRASRRCGDPEIYRLYHDTYGLHNANDCIARVFPLVSSEVLNYARVWGESCSDFFNYAVDSHFEWGNNKGILTVYRLYIPLIGQLSELINQEGWAGSHGPLLQFLGLDQADRSLVQKITSHMQSYFTSVTKTPVLA